ncbi:ent-kaurene synthase, chloroplastic isoform X2 [Rhodamnia argentea]|uniref:Ent-kaurene synthase, chloroplastic isoform X2 n=1 Tax=Rhodamnia argentea TaxID=178133 RepID=A0A8B8NXP2_9MYRT|nr:ent-kaurene synthase, chloroplastic isoform X2 [Rhodamnia argentea]XP_048130720.1 ent-kaurene synthase, chloroplastic isoform X2 [Rhodamnia argentea]
MTLSHSYNLGLSAPMSEAVPMDFGIKSVKQSSSCVAIALAEGSKERISDMFNKVDLSLSSYDTAWVAMVPSPCSPQSPHFPRSLSWLMNNQSCDGSWGLPDRHPLLIKDALLSTLACVLALKQWGVGERQTTKGLEYIASNSASVTDDRQHTPIGFNILLSGMIEQADCLNLNLPLRPADVDSVSYKRNLEVKRVLSGISGRYLSYVAEGMGSSADWEMIMKYQRKNGSLFNSPSTTAAALTHLQNASCLHYLESVLEKFGDAVPTIYPLEIYARLCMIENLERLGIDRHFRKEIIHVLDDTYRCWLQGEEEIFQDIATTAMAFRILRSHGYDVSSDALSQFAEEDHFCNTLEGYVKDAGCVLELYRASQLIINDDDIILDKINSWTSDFLRKGLHTGEMHANRLKSYLSQEVDDALRFPLHANLERVANRRTIELYNIDSTRVLKCGFRSYNFCNKDFLNLAVNDFNNCQAICQEELKYLARWVKEKRLDKLKFARQKLAYCYFSAAATLSSPLLSEARISWAKNGVLTTVVDDFFDVGGSAEELENLIQLVKKWNVNLSADCCSEQVQILFSALHSTISEIGDKAVTWQGRNVTGHVAQIWLELLESMLVEAEWTRKKAVPTVDEYMANGFVSFALGPIVLPTLYLVGPKLSEKQVESLEYHNLFRLTSTCGRLLNDMQGFKRESKEGKLNAVTLQMLDGSGTSEKEATERVDGIITRKRRELLKLVLQEKESVVPRTCKDLFWNMSTVLHFFYMDDDGFTSDEKTSAVKALLDQPITLNEL